MTTATAVCITLAIWFILAAASLWLTAKQDGVVDLSSLLLCVGLAPIVFMLLCFERVCDKLPNPVLWQRRGFDEADHPNPEREEA